MHIINNLFTYTHQTKLLVRFAQIIADCAYPFNMVITVSTVVLNCCKGDKPSQWETPIFGPLYRVSKVDSETEVGLIIVLRQHRTRKFAEITQNNGHYAV